MATSFSDAVNRAESHGWVVIDHRVWGVIMTLHGYAITQAIAEPITVYYDGRVATLK